MIPNWGAYVVPQAENQGSVVSTNIPLPENAPQNNRNARGMDIGVKRINHGTIHEYQNAFASSIFKKASGEFMDFIEPTASALDKIFLIQHLKNFDPEWHEQSLEYVRNLSLKDKYILRAYTKHGDVLINKLIREPDDFDTYPKCIEYIQKYIINNGNNVIAMQIFEELGLNADNYLKLSGRKFKYALLTDEGIDKLIQYSATINLQQLDKIKEHLLKLAQEIKRIINSAPRITKHIRLFRGIYYDYVHNENENVGNVFELRGFQSMSSSIASALNFSGQYNENNAQRHPMLYSFTLHPGTPCIAMKEISHFFEEDEVLVNMDLNCDFNNEFSEKIHLFLANYHFSQIFNNFLTYPTSSVYIKELVIAPHLINRGARGNNGNSNRVSNASFESNARSQESNVTMKSENLNVAFHQLGYNGHGGFTNQSTKLKKTRSNRVFNNQAITRKRNNFKGQIVLKKMNENASKQKEIKAVIERMKAYKNESH
jgi:hypothetical protein